MTESKEIVETDTPTQTESDSGVQVVEQPSSQESPTERIQKTLDIYPYFNISLHQVEDLNTKNGVIVQLQYHRFEENNEDGPVVLMTDGVMLEGELNNEAFSNAISFLTTQLPTEAPNEEN